MNILRKLFDRSDGGTLSGIDAINEGDLFFSRSGNLFHIHKLLRIRKDIWHVLSYKPVTTRPEADTANTLDIAIYHAPVHRKGFESPEFLATVGVAHEELAGYYDYLKIINDYEELASIANDFFNLAFKATDQGNHEEAILNYNRCIKIAPVYWEAIDNLAFAKMDLGRWEDAIHDFKLSLQVNPGNMLAEFSIGECYLRLKQLEKARTQFKLVLADDPTNQTAIDFLALTYPKK